MHVALGGVVPEDAVDHDDLLALVEPSLLVPPGLGLGWRGNHGEPGPDADYQGEDAFKKEKPSPALLAMKTTEAQQSKGQDWGNDVSNSQTCPE